MLKRELVIFLIVGVLSVIVDFSVYHALLRLGFTTTAVSKAISFIAGAMFAYLANRAWTFGHTPTLPGSIGRFALVYATSLAVNVLVNASILRIFAGVAGKVQIAFLVATGASAFLNFIGMKLFVFRQRAASEGS
ncbi:MAG: GtrA family protein [Janthinobacterium lividum]